MLRSCAIILTRRINPPCNLMMASAVYRIASTHIVVPVLTAPDLSDQALPWLYAGCAKGNWRLKVVPCPGTLATVTVP